MKIFFLKEHSLYKIFKTLEKVPVWKAVHIHIDPEHSFFENERRGQQIQELLDKRKIQATFVTKNEKNRKHYEKLGMTIQHLEENKILKWLNLAYMFLFNIKKFHLHVYTKKNFIFYLIFVFEAIFILAVMYLLYSLILPSAKIDIYPAHQVENVIYNFRYYPHSDVNYSNNSRYLSIPFYTGSFEYQYDMTISSSHLKHIQFPSQWHVKFYNKTNKEYSFVPNTRLETSDGRMFQTLNRFKLPPGTSKVPGETIIPVKAMEKDINNVYMWARWNIKKWTQMYIKNFKSSFYLKDVYAKSIENFTGGTYHSEWKVTKEDIAILSGKLYDYIHKQKENIVHKNFALEWNILLPFQELMEVQIQEVKIYNSIWEETPQVKWSVIARLNFVYIKQKDLLSTVNTYIKQRPSEKVQLVTIDTNTLSFFDNIKFVDGVYVIPTKIDIVQGYDFEHDINSILEDIKTKILWQDKNKARKSILEYPEISTVHVKIRPIRYNEVPKLKSRIFIKIEEKQF